MSVRHAIIGLLATGVMAGQVSAQSFELTSFLFRRPAPCDCAPPVSGPLTAGTPTDPGQPAGAPAADSQAFAQAPAAGGEGGASFNPAMFGDLGSGGLGRVLVRTTTVIPASTITVPGPTIPGNPFASPPIPPTPTTITKVIPASTVTRFTTIQVPLIGPGSFKISDNESPRPTDRVFFTYNYFDRVNAGGNNLGLNRELIGFENTFLDGNASFGMRLPFLQTTQGAGISGLVNHEVGDLTLIGKYAVINNLTTGNVLSGGLALTVPSADHRLILADGNALRSVLIQPYTGWIINAGSLFAQGFHSLVVPTDTRDITEINNDVAVGYWLYKSPETFLRGIVPTVEGHIFTPLNHTSNLDLVYSPNIVTLTFGMNFVLVGNSTLGIAVAAPVTGPRPDNIEALVSFNVRF